MTYLFTSCMGIVGGVVFIFAAFGMFTAAEVPSSGESGYIAGQIARFFFTGLFLFFGLVFLVPGVRAFTDLPRRARLLRDLRERGIEAKATVTFVDRNFRTKVNGDYIYTIVEYEYKDGAGNLQSHRLPRIPSEIVIRQKIEVGSEITIVYHPDHPEESGWLELQEHIDAMVEN